MRFIFAGLAVCLSLNVACGKDDSKKQVSRVPGAKIIAIDAAAENFSPAEFDKDIHKICNAEALSGAAEMEQGYNRAMTVAKWLGENLRTPEGRRFLGETAKLGAPKKKAVALAAQAKKSGLTDCPLVQRWSGGKKKSDSGAVTPDVKKPDVKKPDVKKPDVKKPAVKKPPVERSKG